MSGAAGTWWTRDLIAALDSGQLSYAALDALRPEPLPPESPLWLHPKVTVMPHVARRPTVAQLVTEIAANIRSIEAGGRPVAGNRQDDGILIRFSSASGPSGRRRPRVAQVAGDVVAGQYLAHLRLLLRAAVEGVGAAGVEAAARGRVDRARHVALAG